MHTAVSGCGHFLVGSDEEGIDLARRYLSYMPTSWREDPPPAPPAEPGSDASLRELIPPDENKPFDILELIDAVVDAESFLEVQRRWAKSVMWATDTLLPRSSSRNTSSAVGRLPRVSTMICGREIGMALVPPPLSEKGVWRKSSSISAHAPPLR